MMPHQNNNYYKTLKGLLVLLIPPRFFTWEPISLESQETVKPRLTFHSSPQ